MKVQTNHQRPIKSHTLLSLFAFIMVITLSGCGGSQNDLPLPGTIVGKVIDEIGQGIPEVRVVIPNTAISEVTNSNGVYTLHGIPEGTWPILVAKQGYRKAIGSSGEEAPSLYTYVTVARRG